MTTRAKPHRLVLFKNQDEPMRSYETHSFGLFGPKLGSSNNLTSQQTLFISSAGTWDFLMVADADTRYAEGMSALFASSANGLLTSSGRVPFKIDAAHTFLYSYAAFVDYKH